MTLNWYYKYLGKNSKRQVKRGAEVMTEQGTSELGGNDGFCILTREKGVLL